MQSATVYTLRRRGELWWVIESGNHEPFFPFLYSQEDIVAGTFKAHKHKTKNQGTSEAIHTYTKINTVTLYPSGQTTHLHQPHRGNNKTENAASHNNNINNNWKTRLHTHNVTPPHPRHSINLSRCHVKPTYFVTHSFFLFYPRQPRIPVPQLYRISIPLNTPWAHECLTLSLNHRGSWRGPDTRGKGTTVSQGSSCTLPCQAVVHEAKWSRGTRNKPVSSLFSSFLFSLFPFSLSALYPSPKSPDRRRKENKYGERKRIEKKQNTARTMKKNWHEKMK